MAARQLRDLQVARCTQCSGVFLDRADLALLSELETENQVLKHRLAVRSSADTRVGAAGSKASRAMRIHRFMARSSSRARTQRRCCRGSR